MRTTTAGGRGSSISASQSACQRLESRRLLSTIYVDADAPAPHDGTAWGSAYLRLTVALNNASSGDTIEIADGTYFPTAGTDQTATFQLINGVTILGGYAGYGAANPDQRDISTFPTFLSGVEGDPLTRFDNTNTVVTGSGTDATAILDGVTIENGQEGMLNIAGSPTVRNCTFSENRTQSGTLGAGGVQNSNHSNGSFVNCVFTRNSNYPGGAAANDNSFPAFTNCLFSHNDSDAGAIFNSNGAGVRIVNCQFISNSSAGSGGAISSNDSSLTIINCLFVQNYAYIFGGGALALLGGNVLIADSTFTSNGQNPYFLIPSGGAIWVQPALTAGANLTLRNCILWNDVAQQTPEIRADPGTTVTITNSDIEGGYPGAGNINAAPMFVANASSFPGDPTGDQRLLSKSPCLDVGDNSAVPAGILKDLVGAPRFTRVNGVGTPIVDMGAYERPGFVLSPGLPAFSIVTNPIITVHFNEAVDPSSLDVNDLTLNRPGAVPLVTDRFATLSYNAATQTASWNFSHPLPDGNYNAILPAGDVTDMYGYPTEADATASFFFLNGDANHDRHVDVTDLGILATNWQGNGTFSQADFNLDGHIDVTDLGILATNWQESLPIPAIASAKISNRRPRSIVDDVLS